MKTLVKYCGLAALFAGAALCFSNCDDNGPTEPTPYKGVWEWVPTPKCLAAVNDIFFVSSNDGWAVAGNQIWHWDGASWKMVEKLAPEDPRYDYGLTQVWFNGPNDGWVAGIENRTYSVYVSHMWHYDGSSFKEVTIPNVRFIYKMHFNAPDDGWAFGGDYALRYDGTKWYKTQFGSLYWSGCFFWNPFDGWANSMTGIWRWDGIDWTRVFGVSDWLSCIGFATPTNGWALGEPTMSGPSTNAWHWDGTEWKRDRSFTFSNGGVLPFYDIQFLSSNFGWAVGAGTWYWDGERWERLDKPSSGEDGKSFQCWTVFCLDENDVWAGGDRGNIIHFKGFGNN